VRGPEAVKAAGRLRDRQSVPLLVPLLSYSDPKRWLTWDAYTALAAIGTPEAWIALARGVECPNKRHTPCEKARLFGDFLRHAPGVPLRDSAFQAALGETAIASLLDSVDAVRELAPEVVARLGRIDASSHLLDMLIRSEDNYRRATETLIRLTGVDSGPTRPVADSAARARARAFWSQWFEEAMRRPDGLHAVALGDGEAALERWRRRWGP
jgi:HEAT repeat protein